MGQKLMPWEDIGGCGDGQLPQDREWLVCQLEIGIRYLRFVCGEPPKGCELGVMWHEHDICDYPSIGVCWDVGQAESLDAPWEYIEECRVALETFDEVVRWSEIDPQAVRERIDDETIADEDLGN
jgi:hypothetical protein